MDLRQSLEARQWELRGELELASAGVSSLRARLDELDRVIALLPAAPAPEAPKRRAAKGEVEAAVLSILEGKPALAFKLDDILSATGCDRSSVRGALKRLVEAGKALDGVHGYSAVRQAVANGEARAQA